MNTTSFKSQPMGLYMNSFIDYKKSQGYKYDDNIYKLSKFEYFLKERKYCNLILTKEVIDEYIEYTASMGHKFRNSCLSCVRVFSKYLQMRFENSFVLTELPFRIHKASRFYIYTNTEIVALMNAAGFLYKSSVLRRDCIKFLIGLIACTGMRINEALSLTLGDVDLVGQRLLVRNGKFNKSRYIPLDKTVIKQIEIWLASRAQYATSDTHSYFFIFDASARRLSYDQAIRAFVKCRKRCGMDCQDKPPRIHDLRHTYACSCLMQWQNTGVDINAKLPVLATLMGHVDIHSTQLYLHITPAQLHKAANRFHNFYTIYNEER